MHKEKGLKLVDTDTKDYVLKLYQNIYGKKQAGIFCNQHLTKILINRVGFKQSSVYYFIFYKLNVMYVLYTYELILDRRYKYEVKK